MKNNSTLPLEEVIRIPLFHGLCEEDVLPILESAHEKKIHMGEFFFLQGDPSDSMYILVEGRVRLSQSGVDGRPTLIHVIEPIQLFGMVAMTSRNIYPETALAAMDSTAIYWPGHDLMAHVMRVPQLALNAIRIMADQLQQIQDRLQQASTETAERRLAHTLIRLAAQSGKKVSDGILIDMALTRQDFAEMSGTTQYTVSRLLSQWDEQKLVIAGREKVTIRNPHGLAGIVHAEFDT